MKPIPGTRRTARDWKGFRTEEPDRTPYRAILSDSEALQPVTEDDIMATLMMLIQRPHIIENELKKRGM
jgi:hypothetical protein